MEKIKVEENKKSNSFFSFKKYNDPKEKKDVLDKIFKLSQDNRNFEIFNDYQRTIINLAISDLKKNYEDPDVFNLKENSLAEILSLDSRDYLKYLGDIFNRIKVYYSLDGKPNQTEYLVTIHYFCFQ